MVAHRVAILRWLGEHEPSSCSEIMKGTGVPRHLVVPFLSSRFLCNKKPYPRRDDFVDDWRGYQEALTTAHNAPGQYCLSDSGRLELAHQVSNLETT